ncbi:MAG: ABC transporter permease [Bryobacteraceae bacterium]
MPRFFHALVIAGRHLRNHRGFALLIILTMGAAIAAATSVFSLVDTVVLQPLPFPRPDRVISLDTLARPSGSNGQATMREDTSTADLLDWRSSSRSFADMAGYRTIAQNLESAAGTARRVNGMSVMAGFFRVLGVPLALGRDFIPSEEQAGNRSIILSYRLWQSEFSRSPDALGKTVQIGDETYTVIGVMPASFSFPGLADNDYWVTDAKDHEGNHPIAEQRGYHNQAVVARLKDGVSLADAKAEMQTIQAGLVARYPDAEQRNTGVLVRPLAESITGDVRQPLMVLLGAVFFLLLIGCINVAGLLLTRTSNRRGELAIRLALGAGRGSIVRHVLTESLALSFASGTFGFALSYAVLKIAPRVLPPNLPRVESIGVDTRVLLFAIAISIVTGLLFGVFPAWRSSSAEPAAVLGDNSRGSLTGRRQHRLQSTLVIAETAISLVVLVAAGLMIRSFAQLVRVDPGFDPKHVLTFRVGIPGKSFDSNKQLQFFQQLQARLQTLPGVTQATYGFPQPLTGGDATIGFSIDGRPVPKTDLPDARISVVAYNFFQTLGIPLQRGRFFTRDEDSPTAPHVALINESMARTYWPNEDPIGRHFTPGFSTGDNVESSREIIGIVGDVKRGALTEQSQPEYYLPYSQGDIAVPPVALRVTGDPESYENVIQSVVQQINPSLPVYRFSAYEDLVGRSTALQRFQAAVLGAFAALALILAAVGLYALLSYMVVQRTIELGLRIALGAQRQQVLTLILREGLVLSAIGLVVGLLGSVALTRLLEGLLYRTRPLDLSTFVETTAVLMSVVLGASIIPAYRASRLDPNECLRQQ